MYNLRYFISESRHEQDLYGSSLCRLSCFTIDSTGYVTICVESFRRGVKQRHKQKTSYITRKISKIDLKLADLLCV